MAASIVTSTTKKQDLEENIAILTKDLKDRLNEMEKKKSDFKHILERISNAEKDIKQMDYKKTIDVEVVKNRNTEPGFLATNCLICNITCHSKSTIENDIDLKNSPVMDKNGHCMNCPKKCNWMEHKNQGYIKEIVMEKREIILESLKALYIDTQKLLSDKQQLINKSKDELLNLNIECLETQEKIANIKNKLYEIELNEIKSYEDHIDLLIQDEISEFKFGWEKRVRNLKILKLERKILGEVNQGSNEQKNIIENFWKNKINKLE
jgi:hypothetical protein